MKTYTGLLTDYKTYTDDSADNETVGALTINDSIRTICNLRSGKLRFLEETKDMTTVASQASYQVPNGFRKLIDLYVYSGATDADTLYTPVMVFDPTKWKAVQQYKLGTSDVPYFTYVEGQKYFIYPTPATTGNLIRLRGRKRVADLSIADYTTGTITSIANDGTAVVGSGTTWTADMVGRYIRIDQTTAAGGGDGFWYEIGSFTSATSIGLLKPYEGTTISSGTATYTIGQVSVIPEAYQPAIVYRSAMLYWQNKEELEKAKMYGKMYDGGVELGLTQEYGGLMGAMLQNEYETMEGAYISPYDINSPYYSYYDPNQQASGF